VQRLQLEYHSGAFRLISEARLNKVIPASDSLPVTSRALSGFWYELQSPKGEVLYRRILENPITLYTEVPTEKSGGAPSRAEVVPQQTVFSILVPEVPGTNQSVIFSSPPGRSARSEPASARARIPVPGLEKEGAK
jgi:hypothetical protein